MTGEEQRCPQCHVLITDSVCPACGKADSVASPVAPPIASPAAPPPAIGRRIFRVLAFTFLSAICGEGGRIAYLQTHTEDIDRTLPSDSRPVTAAELQGSGRIYFVQMGPHMQPYKLESFAAWLHDRYGLNVTVLPATGLDAGARADVFKPYSAETLFAQLARENPALAAAKDAYLFGFSESEIFSNYSAYASAYTWRDEHRMALISTHGLPDNIFTRLHIGGAAADVRLNDRIQRILLKDLALQYWHLQPTRDPRSLLHQPLYVDQPIDDLHESDLHADQSQWGQYITSPCIFLRYTPQHNSQPGLQPIDGPLIQECNQRLPPSTDTSEEIVEVSLREGLIVDRHVDFYLPDTLPIRFERGTSSFWTSPVAFGMSGSHNYDAFLFSTDEMKHISVTSVATTTDLTRVPYLLPALLFNRWEASGSSGPRAVMRWHASPERFDLTRFDGLVESYLPCEGHQFCLLEGIHDANGQALTLVRDDRRRLLRVLSPHGRSLDLHYEQDRVASITGSDDRKVTYAYDPQGRLSTVAYPSGETLQYTSDSTQQILSIGASHDATSPPRTLLTNTYDRAHIRQQTLADGRTITYDYYLKSNGGARGVIVRTSDGAAFTVRFDNQGATLWKGAVGPRQAPAPNPAPGLKAVAWQR